MQNIAAGMKIAPSYLGRAASDILSGTGEFKGATGSLQVGPAQNFLCDPIGTPPVSTNFCARCPLGNSVTRR